MIKKRVTSKELETQTDLVSDEVEKLKLFHDKYLDRELTLDSKLR